MEQNFEAAFAGWYQGIVAIIEKNYGEQKHLYPIKITEGKRYKKVVVRGAAWAFVDKVSGDVLKPASWSAPAKHARGNIFDGNNGLRYIDAYGPAYLR